jgi:hypothetical protein
LKGCGTKDKTKYLKNACRTDLTSDLISKTEAITYLTSYPDVELYFTGSEKDNLNLVANHWKSIGKPTGIPKNNHFGYNSTNKTYEWTLSSKNILDLGIKLGSYSDYDDIILPIRLRLTSIITWMKSLIISYENLHNKRSMTKDEYINALANFDRVKLLMIGTTKLDLPATQRPAIAPPVITNGIDSAGFPAVNNSTELIL